MTTTLLNTAAASDLAPLLIDVRSPGEFVAGHVEGALNLPLERLCAGIGAVAPRRDAELVLYCASGARSAYGCALLAQMGYTQARNGGGAGALALRLGRLIRTA